MVRPKRLLLHQNVMPRQNRCRKSRILFEDVNESSPMFYTFSVRKR
jgi:hypothetical protein